MANFDLLKDHFWQGIFTAFPRSQEQILSAVVAITDLLDLHLWTLSEGLVLSNPKASSKAEFLIQALQPSFYIENSLLHAGNVLIPADTAGRVFEICLLLEQHWQRFRLPFAIALMNPVAFSTVEFAKSQLEWMNQEISDAFGKTRSNPFDFR